MQTMAVILVGPPGAGKDTLTDLIIGRNQKIKKMEFKEGLRNACIDDYGLSDERLHCLMLFRDRTLKDLPTRMFGGATPREALIATDKRLKEQHGYSIVGRWAAAAVQAEIQIGNTRNFMFSDGGFPEEAKMISAKVDKLLVVNIRGTGLSFDGDSRDYYELNTRAIKTIDFHRTEGEPENDAMKLHGMITDALWCWED